MFRESWTKMEFHRQTSISSTKLLSVALDFGTTYSGYAFSFKHNKEDIKTYCWKSGEFQYKKTSTSILFTPNKKFHAFGFEAEDMYATQSVTGVNKDWYLFRQFKLVLHRKSDLNRHTDIEDITGKKMTAIEVFSAGIRFLKDHVFREFSSLQFIRPSDIQWVLTVPAIWDDAAKQFMRLAANQAEIEDSDLTLALEPEAASVYCKHSSMSNTNQKYMVLDCGGGTVDVALHQEALGQRLKAIYRPTGGIWGGIKVDDAFQTFLFERCGAEAIQEIPKHDFLQMQRSFEAAKTKMTSDTRVVSVWLPLCLRETFTQSDGQDQLQARIVGDKLRLSGDIMKSFFQKPVKNIAKHVKDLLREPDVNISTICMVGGFSNCRLLQEAVAECRPDLTIIANDSESTAVVKGAVLYGHYPHIIRWRKSAYCYGLGKSKRFIEGLHDRKNSFYAEGRLRCKNLFDKITDINESIEVGKTVKCKTYCPVSPGKTSMRLRLFRSTKNDPMYTTDAVCEEVGHISVAMPDITGGTKRKVKVTIEFGDTELKLEAVDPNSKIKYTGKFDFLAR